MADYAPILEALREHGNLRKACLELSMSRSAFLEAVSNDKELADQYARAKQDGIDNTMEELLEAEIKDASISRLEWDRKRWHASKLFPKKYGDATTLKHADADGEKLELDPVARSTRLASIAAEIERRTSGSDAVD